MSIRRKLLSLVILPVIVCTTIAVITASIKISTQGKNGIENKCNAILSLNINKFLEYHMNGEMQFDNGSEDDEYIFRIAAIDPLNEKYQATEIEQQYIQQFAASGEDELTTLDKQSNRILMMHPLYMDVSKGCTDCHEASTEQGNSNDVRGLFLVSADMTPVQNEVKSAVVEIAGLGFIITIISIIAGVLIVRSLIGAFKKITAISSEVSNGNLNVEIDINQNDEIGEMAYGISAMLNKLKQTINDILVETNNIAEASIKISNTSSELVTSANQQASSIEQVSTSMEEMVSNIQQNSNNAKETEKHSLKAGSEIESGSSSIVHTVEAMKSIADKISVITDIASQTNILALNAAVESARAGEHGKGFAVVASEVRKLAERSSEAANEIIQNTSSSLGIAEDSKRLMSDLVPIIQNNVKLIQEISASSVEQSGGADQINNAIQQIHQVSQKNVSSAEALKNISQEMTHLSDKLKNSMSFFKV